METVSVVLADWQVLFREGIHFTLSGEEDIEVIGEVTNSEEALNFIEANPPNVAILNADRGELSGIDVTGRIKQNLPSVSVILIMDSDSEEQLFSCRTDAKVPWLRTNVNCAHERRPTTQSGFYQRSSAMRRHGVQRDRLYGLLQYR